MGNWSLTNMDFPYIYVFGHGNKRFQECALEKIRQGFKEHDEYAFLVYMAEFNDKIDQDLLDLPDFRIYCDIYNTFYSKYFKEQTRYIFTVAYIRNHLSEDEKMISNITINGKLLFDAVDDILESVSEIMMDEQNDENERLRRLEKLGRKYVNFKNIEAVDNYMQRRSMLNEKDAVDLITN